VPAISNSEIDALKNENKKLQAQVLELLAAGQGKDQEELQPEDASKMLVSRLAFNALIGLLLLFVAFSVYAAFLKKDARLPNGNNVVQDSFKTTPADTGTAASPQFEPQPSISDRQKKRDSIKRLRDSLIRATTDSVTNAGRDTIRADSAN